MSVRHDVAVDRVRGLCGTLASNALKLASELLAGIESARDILAPAADEDSEAGQTAALVHALLSDLAASAKPPNA